MATLLSLLVKLGIESGDFNKGMDSAEKKAASFSDSMQKTGQKMMGVGVGLTAGMTLPIAGAALAMVDAASSIEESANAVNVVFGDAADTIHNFGKVSAETAGLATSDFNQMAATTGAFLKNMGFDQDLAADKTLELTERAADMASIFNTDVSQALGAIQSGLKGEFNPLEQFGVKMNAAALETKALAMGLATTKSELTDNMKAQAALALIFEQTDQYAGDFANTSDGLANSTRIMKAEMTNAAAALGTKLLPIGLRVVQFVSDLIDKFTALGPSGQNMILIIGGILAGIGPLVTIIGGLTTAFGAISGVVTAAAAAIGIATGPLLLIIGAVIAVVALLAIAWTQNWGDIQGKTAEFWAWLQPILQGVFDWLSVNIPAALQTLAGFWTGTLLPPIMAVVDWINAHLVPLFQALFGLWLEGWKVQLQAFAGIWQNVLGPALSWVADVVGDYLVWAFDNLTKIMEFLWPILQEIGRYVGEYVSWAFGNLTKMIDGVTSAIKWMSDGLSKIKLPDWLTPGSPTPFEIGLWGIEDALKAVSRTGLPDLQMGLQAQGATMPIPSIAAPQSVHAQAQQQIANAGPVDLSQSSIDALIRGLMTANAQMGR